ncbi:MAG TPA: hypothetical protein VHR66_13435 [Gemmataceae bacterium]|jgi:hypothetical protein|nr:hypothetical protein [Gemmataceae bacterium]
MAIDPLPGDPEFQAKWITDAARTVQAPGMALMWCGIVSVLLAVLLLVILLASPDSLFRPMYDRTVKAQREQEPEERRPLPPYQKYRDANQLSYTVGSIIDLAASVVIVIGGLSMKQVSGYGWAVTGAILATIPCANCVCCFSLPIGMWALVALFGKDVRLAFQRISAMGGLEKLAASLDPLNYPPDGSA